MLARGLASPPTPHTHPDVENTLKIFFSLPRMPGGEVLVAQCHGLWEGPLESRQWFLLRAFLDE